MTPFMIAMIAAGAASRGISTWIQRRDAVSELEELEDEANTALGNQEDLFNQSQELFDDQQAMVANQLERDITRQEQSNNAAMGALGIGGSIYESDDSGFNDARTQLSEQQALEDQQQLLDTANFQETQRLAREDIENQLVDPRQDLQGWKGAFSVLSGAISGGVQGAQTGMQLTDLASSFATAPRSPQSFGYRFNGIDFGGGR